MRLRRPRFIQLLPGEKTPDWQPKRYIKKPGYIVLRWRIFSNIYVETYEHRVSNGRVSTAEHVHHLNGDKSDNRQDNLCETTAKEHARGHNPITWDVVEAQGLYKAGWSLRQLGRKYDVDSTVILRGFQRRGIKTRSKTGASFSTALNDRQAV